jgi:ACR3 family arsenite transporter
LGFFEKYLTVWVGVCIIVGVLIGRLWPAFPNTLSQWEYAQVSIPVAVLIWFMIYPMMVQIDFGSIMNVGKRPKGLTITLVGLYILMWCIVMWCLLIKLIIYFLS